MRILIYGLNFKPELVGIGKYTGEMADWLAQHGHEVRVVTAPPFNPEGKVGKGYSAWRYRTEKPSTPSGSGSLTVFRCPLWISRKSSASTRILHLVSFALSSVPVMLVQIVWSPALVLVVEPTAFCVPTALFTARLSGARSWLHIQDFETDAGFAVGMLKSRFLRAFIATLEKKSRSAFDRISTISQRMLDHLRDKGFPAARSVLFPNWVDTKRIFPTGVRSPLRNELGIPGDAAVALYSGTMGRKQGLEILVAAANRLAGNKNIRFVFCGAGPGAEVLATQTAPLPNVSWLPLQPLERLNELLNLADIHLLPQCGGVADLMMPSKLTGILASGRPVVTTAAEGTQLAMAVQDCGVRVPAHDATAFAEAIAGLAEDASLRARLGRNARQFAELNLDKEKILAMFEQECLRVVGSALSSTAQVEPEKQASGDVSWKSSIDPLS
ncbi:MAG TPA: glycosyltransferase WbuB [Terriglobales bacterium]|nr:glycosyltransferase WbuB [Terriglobales bacterium]